MRRSSSYDTARTAREALADLRAVAADLERERKLALARLSLLIVRADCLEPPPGA